MRINVSQTVSLVDQVINIAVSGCRSLQPITLRLSTTESYGRFSSFGHYLADCRGEVRTDRDRSQSGSYCGLDAMGLFWSLQQDPGQRIGLRFLRRNAAEPINFRLSALPGHVDAMSPIDFTDEDSETTAAVIQRSYLSPEVTRTPVSVGRLRGTLFHPSGADSVQYPGVLDLFGRGGGLMEHRAALLASKGFTVLALAYFGHADLPELLSVFELDYFAEGMHYLLAHPKVRGPRLGLVGTSAGANIVSELAVHCRDQVACVVWLNGMQCRIILPVRYSGRTYPYLEPSLNRIKRSIVNGVEVVNRRDCYDFGCIEEHMLRVEESNSPFLFISSMDDQCVPNYTGKLLAQRLAAAGKTNYRLLQYPGAGHLLEPPYSPLNRLVYEGVKGDVVDFGGEAYWHNLAQLDAWQQMQHFLKRHLD